MAIDDFGAGFTSFRNLRALPVDILKLDGTFCGNLSGNPDNQYFVRSLIDLAHNFGIRTVAEWVETEEDASLLRQWDADFMQGNLFGEASLDPPWQAVPRSRPLRCRGTRCRSFRLRKSPSSTMIFPPLRRSRTWPKSRSTMARNLRTSCSDCARPLPPSTRHFEIAVPPGRSLAEPSFADLVSDTMQRKAG